MTIERAIEILDPERREDFYNQPDGLEQIETAMRMGMEALKKQQPEKPRYNGRWYDCPCCTQGLNVNKITPNPKARQYCFHCGQALDWGDDKCND